MNWGEPYKGSLRNLQLSTVSQAFAGLLSFLGPEEVLSGAESSGAWPEKLAYRRGVPRPQFPTRALPSPQEDQQVRDDAKGH